MSSEQFFDYYLLNGPIVEELHNNYKAIEERRLAIFNDLYSATGSTSATITRNVFERGDMVRDLVFDGSHTFPVPVKLKSAGRYMEREVFTAKPADKSKKGEVYFNGLKKQIAKANSELESAPKFSDYLLAHFNLWCVGRCGPAEGRGYGERISSSRAGSDKDGSSLLFAIPKQMLDSQQAPVIPSEFKKITYGQFYDLTTNVG